MPQDRILRNPDMMGEWQRELRSMVDRVADMRRKLKRRLEELAPSHNWTPIAAQGPDSIWENVNLNCSLKKNSNFCTNKENNY